MCVFPYTLLMKKRKILLKSEKFQIGQNTGSVFYFFYRCKIYCKSESFQLGKILEHFPSVFLQTSFNQSKSAFLCKNKSIFETSYTLLMKNGKNLSKKSEKFQIGQNTKKFSKCFFFIGVFPPHQQRIFLKINQAFQILKNAFDEKQKNIAIQKVSNRAKYWKFC